MNDNLPIEVLEAYDAIEKLLVPGRRIAADNKQVSDCILMMLNNLYENNRPYWWNLPQTQNPKP